MEYPCTTLAPFRAVLVPPDNRLDGAAEVVVLRLVGRAALLDQRCQCRVIRYKIHAVENWMNFSAA